MNSKLVETYINAGLTVEEADRMPDYISGKLDFYDSAAYDKLYEYFAFSGEMPYGIAKARTGTPDEWILDRLEGMYEAR